MSDEALHVDTQALRRIVESSGLRFRSTPISWIFTCPRCMKKDKLYIRKRDGRYICFSGQCTRERFSGKRPEFALRYLVKLSIRDIKAALYGLGPTSPIEAEDPMFFDDDDEVIEEEDNEEFKILTFPYHYYPLDHKFAEKGREYLLGRGISVQLAMQYDIRYSPIEKRVIFPVYVNGDLLGWQGRIVVANEWLDEVKGKMASVSKIESSPSLPKEHVLMFQHRLDNSPHVVLCEGPVDAIKAHLCGGNVAAMGKGVSPGQLECTRQAGVRRFYSGLDPDAATEVGRLISEMDAEMECFQLEPPEDKDLGALSCEEVYDLFRSARRVDSTNIFIFVDS